MALYPAMRRLTIIPYNVNGQEGPDVLRVTAWQPTSNLTLLCFQYMFSPFMPPPDLDSDLFGHNVRPTGKRCCIQAGKRFSVAMGE